ncbi:class I SAM-dependent methyltransferase [Planctomicrobium sp. SH664]|uniref:class I SAM-dependent methyltransferase n=1 Tax=Planctomicrobium sp. SH664 TaxID=3448125 RepID=UPI003F5B6FC7
MIDQPPEILTSFRAAWTEGRFLSLVLSRPVKSAAAEPRRQSVRPIELKGRPLLQWSLQFAKQQTHQNLDLEQSLQRVADLFPAVYQEVNLFTLTEDLSASLSGKTVRLQRRSPSRTTAQPATHNRSKEYLIPEGVPCPFLVALDVMLPNGQVRQNRQKKFRQINRYLEIVNDLVPALPSQGTIRVLDFGCGLSYLTFAVHHLLTVVHQREVQFLGVDQNEHVIQRCREIASQLALGGIEFSAARIESLPAAQDLDLAISLHACDTATDLALAQAVGGGARVILAAPCCQHELFTRIEVGSLSPVLQHGILKERMAALLTDGLRAQALEAAGYRTQVMEFIDLEHTPKNLLIRAVRRESPVDREQKCAVYHELKRTYGVTELATDQILSAASSRET